MGYSKIEEIVLKIAQPILEKKGLELVDVEYKKEGSNWYLRVYVDKPGGVSLDDCQGASEEIGTAVDERDPIPGKYFFEVSSPGLERVLRHERDFERYKGTRVEVRLYKPAEGQKMFQGILEGLIGDRVVLTTDGRHLEFERSNVSLVKTLFEF